MTILIVEDDPMVRSINMGFIKKMNPNFIIFESATLDLAKQIILREKVDLVLLDVYLGNDHGPDLLPWIRNQSIDLDVILITADNSAETVEKAFRFGSIDYLIKPFNYNRFKEAFDKVLTRRSKFLGREHLSQSHIDSLIQSTSSKVDKSTEKGINPMTYDLIESVLVNSPKPLAAKEIAEMTDLARVTVRRYLEFMVEEGLADEMQHYGKVGRPQKSYQAKKRTDLE